MERKKTKMKNKILYIIMAIIIIAGIVVGCTAKFKFSLAYDDSNRIEVYIGKDYTKSDVESIAKEVFGTDDVLVQKIEFFNDSVAITVRESNDDQLNNLVDLINPKVFEDKIALCSLIFYIKSCNCYKAYGAVCLRLIRVFLQIILSNLRRFLLSQNRE